MMIKHVGLFSKQWEYVIVCCTTWTWVATQTGSLELYSHVSPVCVIRSDQERHFSWLPLVLMRLVALIWHKFSAFKAESPAMQRICNLISTVLFSFFPHCEVKCHFFFILLYDHLWKGSHWQTHSGINNIIRSMCICSSLGRALASLALFIWGFMLCNVIVLVQSHFSYQPL